MQSIDCAINQNEMRRDVFQAIADPTRRDIIGLIAKKPMTPNAVAESFGVSRQAISKHMQILLECGLLGINPQGRERYYTVQPKSWRKWPTGSTRSAKCGKAGLRNWTTLSTL